jgi:hypothetical protein
MKPFLFLLLLTFAGNLFAQEGKENYFLTGFGADLGNTIRSNARSYNVHVQYTRTLNRWLRYSVRSEFSSVNEIRSSFNSYPFFNTTHQLDISGVSPSAAEGQVEHDDPNPGLAQFDRIWWSQNNFTTTFYMGFSPIYTKRFQVVMQIGPYIRYHREYFRENNALFMFEHEALQNPDGEFVRTHFGLEKGYIDASANLNVLFAYTIKERFVLALDSTWRLYTDEINGSFDGFGTDGVFGTFIFGIKF